MAFQGFRTTFPRAFEQLYLAQPFNAVIPYKTTIEIEVKFKLRYIFSQRGWQYFTWIDLFLEGIDRKASFDRFIERIGWETAHTMAIVGRSMATRRDLRKVKSKTSEAEDDKKPDDEGAANQE